MTTWPHRADKSSSVNIQPSLKRPTREVRGDVSTGLTVDAPYQNAASDDGGEHGRRKSSRVIWCPYERGCARPRWTGKPLQIAVDDVTGTTEATQPMSAIAVNWLGRPGAPTPG